MIFFLIICPPLLIKASCLLRLISYSKNLLYSLTQSSRMLIYWHSLNTSYKKKKKTRPLTTNMLPWCLFLVSRRSLIFERQMHTSFGWKYRAILHQTHQEGNWEQLQHPCSASKNPSQHWTKTGLMPAPRIPPLECNLLRDFSLLSLLLRSTPGRLNENSPSNLFLIFQTSKLVVNYLSRISRWVLIQSNQLSAFLKLRVFEPWKYCCDSYFFSFTNFQFAF